MMNNTYSMIISQSERAWSFQWARTLFALECQLNRRQQLAYLRKYSFNMADPARKSNESGGEHDDDDDADVDAEGQQKFVPALMIIKRMSYTRAERRRLILGYWQVSLSALLI